MAALMILAALAALVAAFILGMWAGLGLAQDRRQRAACDETWRRIRGRAAARQAPGRLGVLRDNRPAGSPATLLLEAPAPGPPRLPGYTDPFPRPGRYGPGAAPLTDMPRRGGQRPSSSPDDQAPAARQEETETYTAGLVARARHAEGKYLW